MLKIVLAILIFAAYGLYSALNTAGVVPEQVIAEKTPSSSGLWESATQAVAATAGTAVAKAATSTGLQIIPLSGQEAFCQANTVNTEKLNALIEALPENQQEFFNQLLSKTPASALPHIYSTSNAKGLCFSSLDFIILLPMETQ